ncbi:tRNA splicing ligase (endogenous virus) [Lactococcus phage KSY1]|uniref:3'-phosphate/5'-hydroxy nucleic acid ligase n=1 Tax=Lactococcus phage KSY1 TaxID=2913972 RepID=A6MAH4_9CAUD|nr:tRNA splicing ligase [Lactococcus phage KSY1]ABG21652.1 gp109 [Lactococcus phage KSY1]
MQTYTNKDGITITSFATEMEQGLKEQAFDIASKFSDAQVALMPDAHVGTPAPIGLTINFHDIKPEERFNIVELVGNDIGCGVMSYGLKIDHKLTTEELEKIYSLISQEIGIFTRPYMEVHDTFGTLGSGNHFIEIGQVDDKGTYLITVHSGSRSKGAEVYKKYSKKHTTLLDNSLQNELIDVMKRANLDSMIQAALTNANFKVIKNDMTDKMWDYYLKDMRDAVNWARGSRNDMMNKVLDILVDLNIKFDVFLEVNNTHNYFDRDSTYNAGILRKGAINQHEDNLILTPLSMKEGVLVSLPMPSFNNNYSAMHGAGRALSRKLARETVTMSKFKEDMEGIVAHPREEILDEAPDAYKTAATILNDSEEICYPLFIAKPVLNFKGADHVHENYKEERNNG